MDATVHLISLDWRLVHIHFSVTPNEQSVIFPLQWQFPESLKALPIIWNHRWDLLPIGICLTCLTAAASASLVIQLRPSFQDELMASIYDRLDHGLALSADIALQGDRLIEVSLLPPSTQR